MSARSLTWSSRGKKLARSKRRKYRASRRTTSVAAEVKRVLNSRTGGLLGIEKKFFDTFNGGLAITESANCTAGIQDPLSHLCLNCPPQGDGPSHRDGRQISMKSIHVKGLVTIAAQLFQATPDTVPDVFIALVLDKQTNGAQMTSEQLFENPSTSPLLCVQPLINMTNSSRFRVLKTVRVSAADFAGSVQPFVRLTGTGGTTDDVQQQGANVPFSMFVNLRDMKVNFTGTGSLVSNIVDNSLHIVAFTSRDSANPMISYNCRLRYVG